MNLDPEVLGWQEFWLRILLLTGLGFFALLVTAVAVKVAVGIADGARWVLRKMKRGQRHEEAGAIVGCAAGFMKATHAPADSV